MAIAEVTFQYRANLLQVVTNPAGLGSYGAVAPNLPVLEAAGNALRTDMAKTLGVNGAFPIAAANQFAFDLGQWNPLPIANAKPDWIKITMGEMAWQFLPELAPVDHARWLDQIAPCYRSEAVRERPIRRIMSTPTLAIVYQERDPQMFNFHAWAVQTKNALNGVNSPLKISLFPGGTLAHPSLSSQVVRRVFAEHDAVLFFGHLASKVQAGVKIWGWGLTDVDCLSMHEVQDYLGDKERPPRYPVPQVVYAGCCSGAGKDPKAPVSLAKDLSYPGVFLDAGVDYFIGSWMDIIGPNRALLQQNIVDMAVDFFSKWGRQPDYAVHHLYEAKRNLKFHPITSLFLIYHNGEIEAPPAPGQAPPAQAPPPVAARPSPQGAIISGVAPGLQIGRYTLDRQLWADPFSRTFWATSASGKHLLQVFTDEWQGSSDLADEIRAAVEKVQKVSLSPHHLVPTRVETCGCSLAPGTEQHLLVLSFDRPLHETPAQWETLDSIRFEGEGFNHVLIIGANVSRLLAELHAQKIRHGNLEPASIVFCRRQPGDRFVEVFIKDAWLRHTQPGRLTRPRYGPPEERDASQPAEELKADCWGLGVILFELATGKSPFRESADETFASQPIKAALGEKGIPPALEGVVRECLVRSAALRPSADSVWRRLLAAAILGGEDLRAFDADLFLRIAAGQTLFAVRIDDRQDLNAALEALERRGHPVFELKDGEGLVHRQSGHCDAEARWITADLLNAESAAMAGQQGVPPPLPVTPGDVLAFNTYALLGATTAVQVSGPPEGRMQGPAARSWLEAVLRVRFDNKIPQAGTGGSQEPRAPVVVLFGGGWWDAAPAEIQLSIRRMFRRSQYELGSPIVIVADRFAGTDRFMSSDFCVLRFPPLAPAELFDYLLSVSRSEGFGADPIEEDLAMQLTGSLGPCSRREVDDALRTCAIQYGVVDARVTQVRDDTRREVLRRSGIAEYFPVPDLPSPDAIGLPRALEAQLHVWATGSQASLRGEPRATAPGRILVAGPSGYGKTAVALSLGARVGRPVIRIEASRCLQRDLGASEALLRLVLGAVSQIPLAIVFIDGLDRLLGGGAGRDGEPTLDRMSGVFLDWMDQLHEDSIVVFTATTTDGIAPQWLRRIQWTLRLDSPTDMKDNGYRQAVFSAVFRRSGLTGIANDAALTRDLAAASNPWPSPPPIHSPMALLAKNSDLRNQHIRIETPADVEAWIRETILLNAARTPPETAAFWRERLR